MYSSCKGSIVALVTPMDQEGRVDENALYDLIEWHIAEKTDAIVVNGTTGESATLEYDEQIALIQRVVKKVAGRIPVIAGTGTNATQSTIKLTKAAQDAHADACLIVTPYYNRPTQNGLFEHYKAVTLHSNLPIILYNVPTRTSCDLLAETVARLAHLRQIIAIKEATGKLERAQDIRTQCGNDFLILSGDDSSAIELLRAGVAHGVISVTANVAPRQMHEMCAAALNLKYDLAQKINDTLAALHKALAVETNPIPTKWALQSMGKIKSGIRLPLLPLDKQYHDKVKQALQNAGVK